MRKRTRKVTVIVVPLFLVCLYFFLGFTEIFSSQTQSIRLDPIETAPGWLKTIAETAIPTDTICYWVATNNFEHSSLIKLPRFPRKYDSTLIQTNAILKNFSIEPLSQNSRLKTRGIRNEHVSGQIAVASIHNITDLKVAVTDLHSSSGYVLSRNHISVRYVGYVPVERGGSELTWSAKLEDIVGPEVSGTLNPDVVADPLYEYDKVSVPAYRTQPVWITIDIPEDVPPDTYIGDISISTDQFHSMELELALEVDEPVLPDPSQYTFFLDLWLNANAISEYYDVPSWSNEHWEYLNKYMEEYASMGGKTITTIIAHEPWRVPWKGNTMRAQTYSGFEGMIKWNLSTDSVWSFDYSIFERYVQEALNSGINERINAYSLTAFRGREKIHYWDERTHSQRDYYFDSIQADGYKEVWSVFLSSFKKFLTQKGWLEMTYLCFDERPDATMQYITKMIKEIAPEFSNRIAISGHPESSQYASGFLSISYEYFPDQNLFKKETLDVIRDRTKSGRLTTFYLCGQPAHPNTLTFSPAIESRMIPWLAIKYNTQGILRWSFNSWPKDPYENPVFNFIQGDEYILYPGITGPISSIRWELLRDGVEDFELYNVILKMRQGQTSNTSLPKAVDMATDTEDGRFKRIEDIITARNMLLNAYK